MPLYFAVLMLAVMCSMTCALPGTFLVLKRQSMLVDAMSHAVLPGIVLGAIISGSTHSFIMAILAAVMGIIVVISANWLRNTGIITGDANQGLIFPLLFAVGVLLLSTVLHSVHICEDTVLTGDMNLNALRPEHIYIGGLSIGPYSFYKLLAVLCVNLVFVLVCYQVLKLSIFDPQIAKTMGLPARAVEWVLMLLVSLTVVVAFDTAGAILVVALVIVPPATAKLLARTLPQLIIGSQLVAVGSALIGFELAYRLDLPTSAMMAVVDGGVFLVVLLGLQTHRFWRRQAVKNSYSQTRVSTMK